MVYCNISCILSSVLIYYRCCSCCRICSCMVCRCCAYHLIIRNCLRCSCIAKSGLSCSAHYCLSVKLCAATLLYIFYYYISCGLSSVLIYYSRCSATWICSGMICRCCTYHLIICNCLRRSCIAKSRLSCSAHYRLSVKLCAAALLYIFYYNISNIFSLIVVVDGLCSACKCSVCCRTYRNKIIIIYVLLYCSKGCSKLSCSVQSLLSIKHRICALLKIIYHYISGILSLIEISYFLHSGSKCTCCICRCRCCELKVCYIIFSALRCIWQTEFSCSVKFFL